VIEDQGEIISNKNSNYVLKVTVYRKGLKNGFLLDLSSNLKEDRNAIIHGSLPR